LGTGAQNMLKDIDFCYLLAYDAEGQTRAFIAAQAFQSF
jgi:hypothetical protein